MANETTHDSWVVPHSVWLICAFRVGTTHNPWVVPFGKELRELPAVGLTHDSWVVPRHRPDLLRKRGATPCTC